MNILKVIIITGLFVIISGCTSPSEKDLIGTWEAYNITEEEEPIEVDYPSVKLMLNQDGTYEYRGTLNYREAGLWSLESRLLQTKDTLKPDGEQRSVYILSIARDSLELQMAEQDKTRVMKMKRIQE